MPLIFLGAPIVGILTALAAVVAEQLLAVGANVIFQKEIILDVYNHLDFFVVVAAVIEESFKYFAASRVLHRIFGFRGARFVFSAMLAGVFFGLTEAYFVLLADGKKISDVGSLGSEDLFSLAAVILTHALTALLIAVLIASRRKRTGLDALKTIIPPTFVHLLVNFLVIQKGDFTNWLVGIVLGIVFFASLSIMAFNFRELDRWHD